MSDSAERAASADYERAPGRKTLIVAYDPAVRARLAASAAAAGGRIAADAALAAAPALIAAERGTAALILALARDGGADLDRLLDQIDEAMRAARLDALVVAPASLIDIVDARLGDGGAVLLIDPSPAEIAVAVARLVGARGAGVAEPDDDDEQRRLAELSEEAARLARALAGLSERRETYGSGAVAEPGIALAMTRGLIRTRRMREQFLEAALFADPAWDMLLDLFAARLERREVAVSSLCIAAAVPPTTALRWITMMTGRGLIERRPDPADRRRMFMTLSERAADAMTGYVAAALRHLTPRRCGDRGRRTRMVGGDGIEPPACSV